MQNGTNYYHIPNTPFHFLGWSKEEIIATAKIVLAENKSLRDKAVVP